MSSDVSGRTGKPPLTCARTLVEVAARLNLIAAIGEKLTARRNAPDTAAPTDDIGNRCAPGGLPGAAASGELSSYACSRLHRADGYICKMTTTTTTRKMNGRAEKRDAAACQELIR